jgi:hypothetical protein
MHAHTHMHAPVSERDGGARGEGGEGMEMEADLPGT